jgi:hypothetical protein
MNAFENSEIIGRKIAEEVLLSKGVIDLKFTSGKYDVYDCTYKTKDGREFIGEIKCRDDKYAKYPDMLIEKGKLSSLRVKAKELGNINISYINVYPSKRIAKIVDVTNVNIRFDNEYHVEYSAIESDKVNKSIGYIKDYFTIHF